jgi:gamma-glutamyl phosphate reductase
LGHSAGICHIFIDEHAKSDVALRVVLDAKTSYPSACNAVETILVHEKVVDSIGRLLVNSLLQNQVTVLFGARASQILGAGASTADFDREYGDLRVNFEVVSTLEQAVAHILKHGSGHTDSIVTGEVSFIVCSVFFSSLSAKENELNASAFVTLVDSACTFVNASTRFADGRRFGLGAEVGISTGKIHARGPVGVEGLLSTKWILKSKSGDTVGEYEGNNKTKKYNF